MAIRDAHCRGLDLRRRFIVDLCDPSDTHRGFEPSPVGGWCFGGRRLQWGRGSGWGNIFICHDLTAVTVNWPSTWPSTCEKLERWLVRLGTTLINLVDVGPKEGRGGAGGGMGVGVVGAEQRAVAREAW